MGQKARRIAFGVSYNVPFPETVSGFSLITNYVDDKPGLTTNELGEMFYNETEGKMKYIVPDGSGGITIYTL